MSDPASTARQARESLSRGLQAIQAGQGVPAELMQIAEPIAAAMGALMQIEQSNGGQLMPHAGVALDNVRGALGKLQSAPTHLPAVQTAMESVAGALGMVHALAKLAGAPQVSSPPPAPGVAGPQAAADPFAPPKASPLAASAIAPSPVGQPASPMAATQAAAPPGGGTVGGLGGDPAVVVNAELGAQSPTNFYKGLSGNDIVDHGGLFVSTYMIPKIGSQVRLKVSLPGGYEFEADAVVKWAREPQGGSDAPPGFGAQFSNITQEARQLVYRYVRNREPLFHDDL